MGLQIITPPSGTPVSVEEAKLYSRVSGDAEDDLLETLIASATDHVQQATGRQFVTATFALTMRNFPLNLIEIPRSPLVAVESVKYRDDAGTLQTLVANTDYLVDAAAEPPTIEPVRDWPSTGDFPDAVQIQFSAGYPDSNSPPDITANVPARAKVAIKALAGWWYEQREPVAFSQSFEMPYHVTRLLNGLKVWR